MTVAEVLPMPVERRRRLKELETVIESGWAEVVRVGNALREIQEDGLYLELDEGLTFEQYVKSRWSLSVPRAYQLLDAAKVHEATSTIVEVPILNEAVARELAPLLRQEGGKERVAEAWTKIAKKYEGERPPTAKEVHQELVAHGYREQVVGPSSGQVNRSVRLGMVGDKIVAAEKRLAWFIERELKAKPLTKRDQDRAARYRDTCLAMVDDLGRLARGEVIEYEAAE